MKKNLNRNREILSLQKKADKQGVRLQQANARGDSDITDAAVMEKFVPTMKDRDRMM